MLLALLNGDFIDPTIVTGIRILEEEMVTIGDTPQRSWYRWCVIIDTNSRTFGPYYFDDQALAQTWTREFADKVNEASASKELQWRNVDPNNIAQTAT